MGAVAMKRNRKRDDSQYEYKNEDSYVGFGE
jgi:hypothetical protein